jgi:ketosteroid isomerase-like protein
VQAGALLPQAWRDTAWAMSQENVEIVRRAVEAYEHEGLNGSIRYYAPEIEWTTTDAAIERATYRGHDGVRRFFGNFDDEFDDLRFDVEELIDAGEQVVLSLRIGGRGKASGAPVEMPGFYVCSLRDGMIYRIRTYPERAAALEAAGLSE